MSVLAGIVNFDNQPFEPQSLEKMTACVEEFGPDGETVRHEGSVGMLCRSFHTTVESRATQQPFVDSRGNMFTFDGRIDNRDDLRTVLGLEIDVSDISIVAAAFQRWHTGAFARLVGDWALAVWDVVQRTLILARDYIGIKQLYYSLPASSLIWSSHLEPLVRKLGKASICDQYVAGFLALWPEANLTPYSAIRGVGPGEWVELSNGKAITRQYWSLDNIQEVRYKSDEDYEDVFLHLFRQSVKRRLRSDSPLLAELSGGLDSSSVVCMADKISLEDTEYNSRKPSTLSYYDMSEPSEDDHSYFRLVEQQRGQTGFHINLSAGSSTLCLNAVDFPIIPGLQLSETTRKARQEIIRAHNYRVVLSGVGGDELLGQAMDPRLQLADLLMEGKWGRFLNQLRQWAGLMRRPVAQLFFQSLLNALPAKARARFVSAGQVESWVNRNFAQRYHFHIRQLGLDTRCGYSLPGRRDQVTTVTHLSRRMSYLRPSREELRYPFLDQHLVEFLSSIPSDQLLRPGDRRSLMRRALKTVLPVEILSRRTKAGAARSYSVFLEHEWPAVEKMLNSLWSHDAGYLEKSSFAKAVIMMKAGALPPYFVRILKGLSLEVWLRDLANYLPWA